MPKIYNRVSTPDRLIRAISQGAGYPIIETSNDKIIALDTMPMITSIQEQRMMLKLGIILPIPEINTEAVSI